LKLRWSRTRPGLHFPKSLSFPLQLDGVSPTSTNPFPKADRRWGMDRLLGACRLENDPWRVLVRRVQLAAPGIPFRSPSARPSGRGELTDGLPFAEVPRKRGAHVRNPSLSSAACSRRCSRSLASTRSVSSALSWSRPRSPHSARRPRVDLCARCAALVQVLPRVGDLTGMT
jgi:hypothetical protein